MHGNNINNSNKIIHGNNGTDIPLYINKYVYVFVINVRAKSSITLTFESYGLGTGFAMNPRSI